MKSLVLLFLVYSVAGLPTNGIPKFKQFEGTPIVIEHSGWKPVMKIVPIPLDNTPKPVQLTRQISTFEDAIDESKEDFEDFENEVLPYAIEVEEIDQTPAKTEHAILAPTLLSFVDEKPSKEKHYIRRKKELLQKSYPKPSNEKNVKIISHSASVSQKEQRPYHFDFQSENGITRTEDGYLKTIPESKNPAQVMSGSYSYVGPDGKTYTITYIADENGFRAEGSHLPVAPTGK